MYLFHDQWQADDRYGSMNIVDNDSPRFAAVKLSAVITLEAQWDWESKS